VAALAVLALASCAEPRPVIVAGNGHIAAIVRDLTRGDADVKTLIPPAMCPGHFDMRPSDIEALAREAVLLVAPWQRDLPNVTELIAAAGLPAARLRTVAVQGNWMPPPVQAAAVTAIARVLDELGLADAAAGRERAATVLAFGEGLMGNLADAGAKGARVLCSEQQAAFVRWAGLDVVATFGRPEDLSVAAVERLVARARDSGAALVIDNLQSGDAKTGATLAREAGAVHVVLSNFPGGFDDTDTWEKAVERNAGLLLEGLERGRNNRE